MTEKRNFNPEFIFTASRSSGPGGQNVNKVNTRVELRFHVDSSLLLTEEEKKQIHAVLGNRINAEGELLLASQSARTQLENKEAVTNRFYKLLAKALTPRKKRVKTQPTIASQHKRLDKKKKTAQKKKNRQTPDV
jgi:ribosome-associated protein